MNWINFYEMIGGAAATLLGLLFVSVSVNAEKILGSTHTHSRRLAEQAFQNYLAVLMISLMGVFPGVSTASYGLTILWIISVWSVWILIRLYQVLTRPVFDESRKVTLRRFAASIIGFGLLIYGGVNMALGNGDYHQTISIALLVLLLSATVVSWELLISVADEKHGPRES
ncbi:MAG TPA: hypothetical protein VIJ85_06305 [Rhizomicrobium sp.]